MSGGGRTAGAAEPSDVPSVAEVAEQAPSGETQQGDTPSIAEMAESLVGGGGEPIPSSGPSKESESGREAPIEGRKQKFDQDVGTKVQQEPGLSEPLAIAGEKQISSESRPLQQSLQSEKEQTALGKEPIGLGAESGRPVQYEYLPHPADIQFHSWGSTKTAAFEHMADCMFNYLANIEKVDIDSKYDFDIEVTGEDDKDLLYKFLDELLFRFNTRQQIICRRVSIDHLAADRLHAVGHGEPYNAEKHSSGTEIKAITLASLQVNEQPDRTEAYVIVDI